MNTFQALLWFFVLSGLMALWFSMKLPSSSRLAVRLAGVVLITFGVLAPWLKPAPASSLHWTEYNESNDLNGTKPVLLYFHADWCAPCAQLELYTFSDKRVEALSGQFNLIKMDMSDPRNPKTSGLIEEYNIEGVPVIAFLKNGRELKSLRFFGFIHPEALLNRMEAALASDDNVSVSG